MSKKIESGEEHCTKGACIGCPYFIGYEYDQLCKANLQLEKEMENADRRDLPMAS